MLRGTTLNYREHFGRPDKTVVGAGIPKLKTHGWIKTVTQEPEHGHGRYHLFIP